jgi:hypothetical protein
VSSRSRKGVSARATAVCWIALLAAPAVAAEETETLGDKTIDELIVELEKRGVVTTRPAADETPPVSAEGDEKSEQDELLQALLDWFDRIDIYGDFRGRFEGFVYDNDTNEEIGANDPKDRYRWRYRLRIGMKADINEYFDAAFRLATGPDANSRNQTLGSGVDWDPDDIFVDQAYVTANPFGGCDCETMYGHVRLGKMSNPFRSKKGYDSLHFDGDIMPEGLALNYGVHGGKIFTLNTDFAYYIINEGSSRSADPHLLASQLDFIFDMGDHVSFGFSPSHYAYRNLNQGFFDRGTYAVSGLGSNYGGNVPVANQGGSGLGNGSHVQITVVRVWVEVKSVKAWPMLVYGSFSKNHTAKNTTGYNAGKEDTAWSVGTTMGDKKKNVRLDVGYFVAAANSLPANFTDSDLFDGRTNGKGWRFKVARQIFANTDLSADLFYGKPLKDDIFGPSTVSGTTQYNEAIRDHERLRFRLDVTVKW